MSDQCSRRAVYFLDVEPTEAGGITSQVSLVVPRGAGPDVLLDETKLSRTVTTVAARREREARVVELVQIEKRFRGSSFVVGDHDRDLRAREFDRARHRIAAWDFEHVIAPIGELLLDCPNVLVSAGSSDLPRFSAGAAVREGIAHGALPENIYDHLACVPTWAETAVDLGAHLAKLALFGLPPVAAERSVIVLGADAPNEFLRTVAVNVRDDEKREVLEAMPAELRNVTWLALLRSDLVREAEDLGIEVHADGTRTNLVRALSRGHEDTTLFFIAHQDDLGIHLCDAPLPLEELADQITIAPVGGVHGTVDLAICAANSPGNVASAFSRRGASVVLTRGAIGHQGRAMARLLGIVRLLREGWAGSLPALHNQAWLREVGRHPRATPRRDTPTD